MKFNLKCYLNESLQSDILKNEIMHEPGKFFNYGYYDASYYSTGQKANPFINVTNHKDMYDPRYIRGNASEDQRPDLFQRIAIYAKEYQDLLKDIMYLSYTANPEDSENPYVKWNRLLTDFGMNGEQLSRQHVLNKDKAASLDPKRLPKFIEVYNNVIEELKDMSTNLLKKPTFSNLKNILGPDIDLYSITDSNFMKIERSYAMTHKLWFNNLNNVGILFWFHGPQNGQKKLVAVSFCGNIEMSELPEDIKQKIQNSIDLINDNDAWGTLTVYLSKTETTTIPIFKGKMTSGDSERADKIFTDFFDPIKFSFGKFRRLKNSKNLHFPLSPKSSVLYNELDWGKADDDYVYAFSTNPWRDENGEENRFAKHGFLENSYSARKKKEEEVWKSSYQYYRDYVDKYSKNMFDETLIRPYNAYDEYYRKINSERWKKKIESIKAVKLITGKYLSEMASLRASFKAAIAQYKHCLGIAFKYSKQDFETYFKNESSVHGLVSNPFDDIVSIAGNIKSYLSKMLESMTEVYRYIIVLANSQQNAEIKSTIKSSAFEKIRNDIDSKTNVCHDLLDNIASQAENCNMIVKKINDRIENGSE